MMANGGFTATQSRSDKEHEPFWSASAPAQPLADSALFKLFALHGSENIGQAIAAQLGCPLSQHEEREFEDGEHKARPLDDVRGAHAYVVHSLHGGPVHSADEKLCRLPFFIAPCDGGHALSLLCRQGQAHEAA